MTKSGPPSGEVVFAAISPHGGLSIAPSGRDEDPAQARATQQALLELGRRFEAVQPDTVILFTPHNVHVEGHFAAIDAGTLRGQLGDEGEARVHLECAVDRQLLQGIRDRARADGLPLLAVSYGGNDQATAAHPMDWATLIPLWYLGGRSKAPAPVAVVSPARDRPAAEHLRMGEAIRDAIVSSGKRVAIVASCDQGHGHDASGPYGFRPESAAFDEMVQGLVGEDRFGEVVDIDPGFVSAAAADSWWQMLMLRGALGDQWRPRLLSYEHPTYFGLLVADFLPRGAAEALR